MSLEPSGMHWRANRDVAVTAGAESSKSSSTVAAPQDAYPCFTTFLRGPR